MPAPASPKKTESNDTFDVRHSAGAGRSPATAHGADIADARQRFFNRETSWLAFNKRVLEEAGSEQHALLDRVNFLAITGNNLDEFFMKRVGGLKRQFAAGVKASSLDGRTPGEQLDEIRVQVLQIMEEQSRLLVEDLIPKLHKCALHFVSYADLAGDDERNLHDYFEKMIYPILTPLGVGPGQPFPFISNLSLSLAVMMHDSDETEPIFARVKIPTNRPRWIQVLGKTIFVPLEDLIAHHLTTLFPGMEILEWVPFRVTRNAELERNEEEADDLLEVIEEELRNRKFAPIVRLEIHGEISESLRTWLVTEMGVDAARDLYQRTTPLGLRDLTQLARLDLPHLREKPMSPVSHPRLARLGSEGEEADIFAVIRKEDLLVHHPFQSFQTSVLGLLEAAAVDRHVLAIKQTLYRTAANSPIIAALLKAAEKGKEVSVQVEIKARFDEANNIEWVRTLERAGVHVTYGFVGLKTHSKTMLIVREDPDGIRRYAHVGTGNYHTGTARLYTDVGLFTCDPVICQDIADLFNFLTGHSKFKGYRKLLVAPVNMRQRFLEMIRREIKLQNEGVQGQIIAKMNQLEDPEIIQALYEASQAGVQIDLIIRGFCCLRPGVPGLSENIRVMCIIARLLEHSRIFHFRNGGEGEYYIGSADWMSRNLNWRVEAITPIESPPLRKELDFILKQCLADHRQAWDLQPDGTYMRRRPRRGKGAQTIFSERALEQLNRRGHDSKKSTAQDGADSASNGQRMLRLRRVKPARKTR